MGISKHRRTPETSILSTILQWTMLIIVGGVIVFGVVKCGKVVGELKEEVCGSRCFGWGG